jgi:hypothetical protein
VKNGVELFIIELLAPIETRQILRHEIAAISGEIFEITRPKVVNYRDMRVLEPFLQRQGEIGADEAGASGDNEVQARVG